MLRELGVEDADAYIDEHDDLSPKTLANHITLLITMLNYAASFRDPSILKVPRFKKPKIAALGRNYSYLRSQEEIRSFLSRNVVTDAKPPSVKERCDRSLFNRWIGEWTCRGRSDSVTDHVRLRRRAPSV